MTDMKLRHQLLTAFAQLPNTSLPICLRLKKHITSEFEKVLKCLNQLVQDGLVEKTERLNRLPPQFRLSAVGASMFGSSGSFAQITQQEQRHLKELLAQEEKFAQDQETVYAFLQKLHPVYASTLMVQDVLRKTTREDNNAYTHLVLNSLAANKEIESKCSHLLWKLA
jgi:hypothetical protein